MVSEEMEREPRDSDTYFDKERGLVSVRICRIDLGSSCPVRCSAWRDTMELSAWGKRVLDGFIDVLD